MDRELFIVAGIIAAISLFMGLVALEAQSRYQDARNVPVHMREQ